MRRFRFGRAAIFAAITLILSAQGAWADNLDLDGDGAAPVAGNAMSFGSVCMGATPTKAVIFQVHKTGSDHFANGANVAISMTSATSGLSATGTSISLPANWNGLPNGTTRSGTSTAGVTFSATTLEAFSGSVDYAASGPKAGGGTLTDPNSLEVTATVVSCDSTPPVLNLPAPITAEATGPGGAAITYSATATDANPANPVVTCGPASGGTFAIGTTAVNCSATDAANNTATGAFTITVQDTTGPTITGTPGAQSVEATGPAGAIVTYSDPTATDIVDGGRPVTCLPASGSTFAIGPTTVVCSSSDTRSNTSSTSFVVAVSDTTAPALILPIAMTVEATSGSGASVLFGASATDVVDGAIAPDCDRVSGDTFPLGTTTISCSATDAAGNTASGSFDITVVDTTPPSVVVPASFSVEATGPGGAVATFSASATDVVDGGVTTTCSPASGAPFALGVSTVTCSATDAAGNTGTASFVVTVVDTTPPDLSLPGDQVLEATGPGGAAASFAATASDIVDGAITPTCSASSGDTFPLGSTLVSCTATDAAGNSASGSFTISVVDTTPPAITVPADVTAEATGPSGAAVTFATSASDIVDGAITPTCSSPSGDTFPLGSSTVTCSATDAAGNTGTASFTITVVDTTPPTVTVPADITTDPTSLGGAVVTYGGESGSDLVDGPVSVSCVPPSGSLFGFGPTTVTCSATDAAGNTGSGTFTVTVNDLTFRGFYQPVDMAALNTVKGGSTVPVKWELFGAGGLEFTSTAAVVAGWPKAQKVDCGSLGALGEDAIETTATGGTSLRYDVTAGQFIYNWQTPKQAGTCWRLDVKFVDGSTKSASFKLK
jgi:hypothetical protein